MVLGVVNFPSVRLSHSEASVYYLCHDRDCCVLKVYSDSRPMDIYKYK